MTDIVFYIFSGIAVVSALTILISKNILYSAFALVATFLAIAGLYAFAGAEFVAVTQIMVYVGGIVVLLIFGVMLTNRVSGSALITGSYNRFTGFVIATGLCLLLIYSILEIRFPQEVTVGGLDNIKTIGIGLMSNYLLLFELAAIILLIALIGASTIAHNNE